ncbi:MAG: hypothetical protein E6K53_02360 [Gammaproteobacteria bacterium]|nr:MAG: hypothetical protein E6K53_02360 [Gammaproteobacteria bacterium]
MRKLFALLLIVSMPLAGVAQSLAPAQPSSPFVGQLLEQRQLTNSADTHAIPLWGTPDGRILAMISTSSATPALPLAPQLASASEWRLIDVTQLVSTGVRMRLGESANAHVDLSQSALLAPACEPGKASCATEHALANSGQLRLGLNWLAGNDLDLDLYYGLSWLRHNTAAGTLAATNYTALPGTASGALPALVGPAGSGLPALLPGLSLADTQTSSINALGRLHLNDTQAFDFGASLSRIQLSIPGAAPLTSLNQAAVSFGMEYGAFSGTLTGHLLGTNDVLGLGATRWSGLDIGLSWRTPWRGRFSVGAQNLWSSGSLPLAPPVREGDANQARVPYVQYRQDL